MECPNCQGTMRGKTVNTSKGPRQVFECNQDNGECLNEKGYPTSVWPKGGGRGAAPQRPAPPQQRAGGNGGADRSAHIERQHSQEMALRLAAIDPELIDGGEGKGTVDLKKLRWFIDWFHKDVSNTPARPQPQQREPEPAEPEPPPRRPTPDDYAPPEDDDIPF